MSFRVYTVKNTIFNFTFQVNSNCHKYIRKILCGIHFNPCDSPLEGFPCRESCYEQEDTCFDLNIPYKEFNSCEFHPTRWESDSCYWPNVTCDPPRDPNYGHVEFTDVTMKSQAVYHCNMLFNLKGNKIRTCLVSCKHNESRYTPHGFPWLMCKKKTKKKTNQ